MSKTLAKAAKSAKKKADREKAEDFAEFTDEMPGEDSEEGEAVVQQNEKYLPKGLATPVDPDLLKERICDKLRLTEGELSTLMDDFPSDEQTALALRIVAEKNLKAGEVKMYGLPTELFKKGVLNRQEAEWMAGSTE